MPHSPRGESATSPTIFVGERIRDDAPTPVRRTKWLPFEFSLGFFEVGTRRWVASPEQRARAKDATDMPPTTIHFVPTNEQAERIDDFVDRLPRASRSAILRFIVARGLAGLTRAQVRAAIEADPSWIRRQPPTRRPKADAGEGTAK